MHSWLISAKDKCRKLADRFGAFRLSWELIDQEFVLLSLKWERLPAYTVPILLLDNFCYKMLR